MYVLQVSDRNKYLFHGVTVFHLLHIQWVWGGARVNHGEGEGLIFVKRTLVIFRPPAIFAVVVSINAPFWGARRIERPIEGRVEVVRWGGDAGRGRCGGKGQLRVIRIDGGDEGSRCLQVKFRQFRSRERL